MRDLDIRLHIKDSLLKHYYEDTHSKVVRELSLPIAKARIDVAVINGHLHGYEIKSASDTLTRLPNQMIAYQKVFDYVSVITEEKYAKKIQMQVPDWVGIYVCTDTPGMDGIVIYQEANFNEHKEGFHVAKLLWKEELIEVLQENKIAFRKSDRTWLLCDLLASSMDIEYLSLAVREKLKKRMDWKMDSIEGCAAK